MLCVRWITRKAGRFLRRPVSRAAAAQGVRRRRSARVVAPTAKPARAAHAGGSPGGTVRKDGFEGRARGELWVGGRRARSRSRDGLSRAADALAMRATAPPAKAAGTAAPRNGAPVPERGVRLTNPDAALFGARRRRANLRETPVGDETSGAAQSDPHNGSRRPPRASGSSGNGRSRRGGMLMRSASGARDRGWSFTAYSLDPEASGNVSAGHVAPTPRSRP